MSGFRYLERFVSDAGSPRILTLVDILEHDLKVPYTVDEYKKDHHNVYVNFPGYDPGYTSVLVAHHDVAVSGIQNCQDNTASVANLLHVCQILQENPIRHNVVVCFTDEEEIVSFDNSGAARLARLITGGHHLFDKFLFAYNLELTGLGRNVWVDFVSGGDLASKGLIEKVRSKIPNVMMVSTPFNDSTVLRYNGVDSVCLGICGSMDAQLIRMGRPPTVWSLCHKATDTIDKISETDMNWFVRTVLLRLL